jgi:hypothetical protein
MPGENKIESVSRAIARLSGLIAEVEHQLEWSIAKGLNTTHLVWSLRNLKAELADERISLGRLELKNSPI